MTRPWKHVLGAVAVSLIGAGAAAAQEDSANYDRNGNGKLDPGAEVTVYALHKTHPTLAGFDKNLNGQLDDDELAAIRSTFAAPPSRAADLAIIGSWQDSATHQNGIPIKGLETAKPPKADICAGTQRGFVRRDRLDISAYTGAVTQKEAKGASLALAREDVADLDTLEAHGVMSYIVARTCLERPADSAPDSQYVSGYALAGWILADGVRTNDNPDKDKSALKIGFDAQLGLFGGDWLNSQYLAVSPYYQTDFRADGRAYGASLSWEPYALESRLGGSYRRLTRDLDFYWQIRGEADWLHVEDAGRTSLKADTDYVWVGGQVSATVFPWSETLDQRLKLYASFKYHRDVNNGRDARLYVVGAGYNLTNDGAVSLSLDRTWGLEREKMIDLERTVLSLNFKH